MYVKINENKFNELIDEIKLTCESKQYPLPSLIKNHNIPNEYLFSDNEGREFKQFLEDFPEFKDIVKFMLNEEQEGVVTYDNHKFLSVEAGPGAGKTRVLIEKVQYMVNELGVKPESLLIITFSTKAAEELQERLIEGDLSKSDVQKMQISTIHSLCIKLLEEHGDVGYDIIADDYGEKVNMFVGKHLKDLGFVDEYYIPNSQISYIIKKYDEYSAFKVDTDKLVEYIEKEWPVDSGYSKYVHDYMETHDGNFPRKDIDNYPEYKKSWYRAKYLQIARSYPIYKELLEKVHAIDFNQMQIKALELLEKNNVVQYTNVLIDEFQDTDPIQMKIFEQLMDNIKSKSEPKSFTVVGDINQRIYGFRGSTKNYFKYLRDNCADDFEFKSLPTNYRSTNQIIDISEDFIKYQRDEKSSLQKPKYGRKVENNVYYMLNEDKVSEARNLFEIIKYLKKEGKINHYSDIGILARSVKGTKFKDLIDLLDEHNLTHPDEEKIPYKIKGLSNILDRDEIKSILTLMYHLVQDENPHNHIMDGWTSKWLNLKAYTGANFNQVLFNLSDETKEILNKLQDDFEQRVQDVEKEVYYEETEKTSQITTFSGVFKNRDEEMLIKIFNRLERPVLTDENLIRYGVTNKDDLKFFKELNKLKRKVSSDEVEFYNRPTVSDVYFELLTKITGYFTEDNINAYEEETFNLSSLTQTISNFEEMRYERDFRGFYWFVYRTIDGHDAYSTEEDGVQIMTVHSSKGLEFPVTILASLSDKGFPMEYKDPNPKSGWIHHVGYAFYTPKHFLDYKKDEVNECDTYEQIMEKDKKIYYEEEERVIYVAMTRAEDTLILSSIVDNCEASRKIALERPDDIEYLKSITKAPGCVQKAIDDNLTNKCILINPNNIEIDTIPREPKEIEGELVNLSFTALENYQSCPFKYKMSNILNFNKSQRAVIEDGIFIHDALDVINKKIKLNNNEYIGDDEVASTVESLFKKDNYDLEEKDPDKFESKLKRITEDVLYYYNNYGKHLKIIESEYPFHYKDTHYVLNGKIDLICERDGKLVILDYKNTSLEYVDEEVEEKYRQKYKKQLHLYVLALRDQNKEYIGRDIDEVEIYAIKSKDVLTFNVEENIIEDLKVQLNQAALDIKSGDKFGSRQCGDCKYCQYSKICNQNLME